MTSSQLIINHLNDDNKLATIKVNSNNNKNNNNKTRVCRLLNVFKGRHENEKKNLFQKFSD